VSEGHIPTKKEAKEALREFINNEFNYFLADWCSGFSSFAEAANSEDQPDHPIYELIIIDGWLEGKEVRHPSWFTHPEDYS
jgi:hypothetical protein